MTSLSHPRPLADPSPSDRGSTGVQPVGAPALRLLPWAFAGFNLARLLGYLPTLWSIHAAQDASQHSVFTWLTWAGANATMALWLYEQNRYRCNSAILLNAANAVLCLATLVLILAHRL